MRLTVNVWSLAVRGIEEEHVCSAFIYILVSRVFLCHHQNLFANEASKTMGNKNDSSFVSVTPDMLKVDK